QYRDARKTHSPGVPKLPLHFLNSWPQGRDCDSFKRGILHNWYVNCRRSLGRRSSNRTYMNEGAATATPDPFCRTGDIVQQAGTGSPQPQHQTSGFPAQLALNGSPFSRSKHYGMQTVRPYVGVVKSISL